MRKIKEKVDLMKMWFGYAGYIITLVSLCFLVIYYDRTYPSPDLFIGFMALLCLIAMVIFIPLSIYVIYTTGYYLLKDAKSVGDEK